MDNFHSVIMPTPFNLTFFKFVGKNKLKSHLHGEITPNHSLNFDKK